MDKKWGRTLVVTLVLGALALGLAGPIAAQERVVKIAGFGTMSGVVRLFGVNSHAVLQMAVRRRSKVSSAV